MAVMNRLFTEYHKNVLQNKEAYLEEYKRVLTAVETSPAKYKNKPVEFLYQPMFLSQEDVQRFQQLTTQLLGILKKVIRQYLEEEAFRKHFGFSPLLEKLILKDPGYSIDIPMGRFDIFYHFNEDFQFCELNADGSSGMVEERELQYIFKNSLAIRDLQEKNTFTTCELFDSWVEALLINYKEFNKEEKNPKIAIVDRFSSSIPSEFIEFQKAFERRGYATVIADIRDLTYRDKKLYYKDFQIDCIYRRAVTWEIVDHAEEVQDFIEAYLEGAVCVVGSIRSQIIHNKNIFSILHDPLKTPFLTEEERRFVEKHIPYTVVLGSSNKELIAFAIANKEELVLKPMDRYASSGVYIGRDFTPEQWEEIIEKESKKDYLLQQLCRIPKLPMAMFTENDVDFIENNYIIGLFMYNEKLQGVYTRVGRKNIIGSIAECFTLPNFIEAEKL
ncbi:glutathionylspermidine synthase [Clostridium aceticum]|uniref:Glutathionylspermidine synthase n=1 Tax=Clostridium aceticum TaxID=84022 RepID=A0A0D8I7D1_9CLOT|nr:glutathionylspermidine synthase family protein [Clostridium aceticum]AKL97162.1 glutathionylspermidine synthase [Clostridium aceticum]KJF26200.1 hypothetical protein TZ02_13520 [Clostridium aceticum]